MSQGPFDGVRILELGNSIGSSMACMMLADQGAEVIKVETPDEAKAPRPRGYYHFNHGKAQVLLDLDFPDDLKLVTELARHADVVVVDRPQTAFAQPGLLAPALLAANPRLLVISMPPFGEVGPLRDLPPEDILIAAATGTSAAQYSYKLEQPVHLVLPLLSYGQAFAAAGAVAAGLCERESSGQGQHVIVSGLHGVVVQEAGANVGAGEDGKTIRRGAGKDSRGTIPWLRCYECADGEWLFLVSMTEAFVLNTFTALGMEDLLVDPRFDHDVRAAIRNESLADEIQSRLEAAFKQRPCDEWISTLRDLDVPVAPVWPREQWFDYEQTVVNEMKVAVPDPEVGEMAIPGLPVKYVATPGAVRPRILINRDALPDLISRWASTATSAPTNGSSQEPNRVGPLQGVKVLDLTAFVAGPVCSTILADYGASIVKVEPLDGDSFRPYRVTFLGWNRGRDCLSLDLKSEAGREMFYDLVKQVDVVVDNFRPGVADSLGIGWDALDKINPRIISCSISGYGAKGPMGGRPGFDPLLQAQSGMQRAQGGDAEPVFLQIGINDTGTGAVAAFGVIGALYAREKTGCGQQLYTYLANQSIMGQSGEICRYPGAAEPEPGGIDLIGRSPVYRFYRCADNGWVAIACRNASDVEALYSALKQPKWSKTYPPETVLNSAPTAAPAGEIDGLLGAMKSVAAAEHLRGTGVPATVALKLERELFEDEHLSANGFWHPFQLPTGERFSMMTHWALWGRTQAESPAPAGDLGSETIEVLRRFGVSEEKIQQLLTQKVARQAAARQTV